MSAAPSFQEEYLGYRDTLDEREAEYRFRDLKYVSDILDKYFVLDSGSLFAHYLALIWWSTRDPYLRARKMLLRHRHPRLSSRQQQLRQDFCSRLSCSPTSRSQCQSKNSWI